MKYSIAVMQDISVPESVNEFLNYSSTIRGKSPNTIAGYKVDLIMFFRFLKLYKGMCKKDVEFEDIQINDIDEKFIRSIKLSDLYAFISFAENYRNNGTYARARKVAALKSFFKYLSGKTKIIDENPAIELESPKISKRNPVYLTLEESKNLLRAVDPENRNFERDFCIITLFLNCGLRLSELCSIDMSKIKGDTLTIIGKGNKERTVYLNNACLKAISQYMSERMEKTVDSAYSDALFVSEKNAE